MLWNKPDVLFIPASSMPIIHPRKTVVTVHDLAFMFYPETYTAFMRYFHMFEDVLVSQLAWKIIAVSESTKKDFVKVWKANDKRISVVHHGYTSQAVNSEQLTVNSELELPERFVLFLSTLQPRKNLEGLIAGFRLFKEQYPENPHKLVVAGKVGWKAEKILEEIERNKDAVVYLNHVTDSQRTELYAQASALAMPSFYEGFGMWILEAFDAGVPLITSNISSMPEVAGNAAEYCDPNSHEDIARSLARVLTNPERATELKNLGKQRLVNFSWRRCAEETLSVLKS
jgi:glycosyltransferase involved in cell wall biosynthesis